MAPELCCVDSAAFFVINDVKTDEKPERRCGRRFRCGESITREHNERRYISRSRIFTPDADIASSFGAVLG
jgi:hypothetical protein